jgi:hypothetical protein
LTSAWSCRVWPPIAEIDTGASTKRSARFCAVTTSSPMVTWVAASAAWDAIGPAQSAIAAVQNRVAHLMP